MAARQPGIRLRLEEAAFELFEAQGFAETTATQIASRAGTTERTFFRHFHDKTAAAFGDESRLREVVLTAVRAAPAETPPWLAAQAGLETLAAEFDKNREAMLRRGAVVAANPTLREREAARAEEWVSLLGDALDQRGAEHSAALLTGALASSVFRTAIWEWSVDPRTSLLDLLRLMFARTRDVVGGAMV